MNTKPCCPIHRAFPESNDSCGPVDLRFLRKIRDTVPSADLSVLTRFVLVLADELEADLVDRSPKKGPRDSSLTPIAEILSRSDCLSKLRHPWHPNTTRSCILRQGHKSLHRDTTHEWRDGDRWSEAKIIEKRT